MAVASALLSSASAVWGTPQGFFDDLHREFRFEVDVCALPDNAKCPRYFTADDDGLAQAWAPAVCWMNPPYGRDVGRWMAKALEASRRGATVVALVPSRTDTRWWHENAVRGEVRFVPGRLRFGGSDVGAPFPSAVVVFRPTLRGVTRHGRICNGCGLSVLWRGNAKYCSNACRQRAYRQRRAGR